MNTFTKSINTLKVAALGITAAAGFLHAQNNGLLGKVPMDFVANGKSAVAGTYRLIEQRPGVVIVKTESLENVMIAMLPVQTEYNAKRSLLTFERKNGEYRLTGYCIQGRSCWATPARHASSEKFEVALSATR